MSVSLSEFHFSAEKSSKIFQQFRKERNMSQSALEKRTGISYDTVGNILTGKVRDIKLEVAFKFCVALGIPFAVYIQLMLNDEGTDFADEVLLYDPKRDKAFPVGDHDVTASAVVPDSVAAVATSTPVILPPASAPDSYTREELTAILDRVAHCHDQHVADMRANAERQQEIICRLIEKR